MPSAQHLFRRSLLPCPASAAYIRITSRLCIRAHFSHSLQHEAPKTALLQPLSASEFTSHFLQSVRTGKSRIPSSSRSNESTSRRSFPRIVAVSPNSRANGSRPNGVRYWLNNLPESWILWSVLAVNGVVYLAWHFAAESYRSGDPSGLVWMQNNFTVSLNNFASGRIWTLLTACFSHEGTAHIFMNGLSFYWLAPGVMSIIGNARFLSLYLGGGVLASAISLLWHNQVKNHRNYSSHGASGAINAILAFIAFAAPRSTLLIFGIVPTPTWVTVGGLFMWDLLSAIADKKSRVDAAGHVGGSFAGAAYFMMISRRLRRF